MSCYSLKIHAPFLAGSATFNLMQLTSDLVALLDNHSSKSYGEQIRCEDLSDSITFHRLYSNVIDDDVSLVREVAHLGERYPNVAFKLTEMIPE